MSLSAAMSRPSRLIDEPHHMGGRHNHPIHTNKDAFGQRQPSLTKSQRSVCMAQTQQGSISKARPQPIDNWSMQQRDNITVIPVTAQYDTQHVSLSFADDETHHSQRAGSSPHSTTSSIPVFPRVISIKHSTSSYRKSVFGLFDESAEQRARDDYCCCCQPEHTPLPQPPATIQQETRELRSTDTTADSLPTPPSPLSDDQLLPVAADVTIDSGEVDFENESQGDSGRFSCRHSSLDGESGWTQYRSCPDLCDEAQLQLAPALTDRAPSACTTLSAYEHSQRVQQRHSRRRKPSWLRRQIRDWGMDELLTWLQHLNLDHLAAFIVGYDISGREVENWNEEALAQLGIVEPDDQDRLLGELDALRLIQRQAKHKRKTRTPTGVRQPLFNLVRASSYDQIVAVELPLCSRDLLVAETGACGLQVTKVNKRAPIQTGDCILEVNSTSATNMAAVDFNKLIADAAAAGSASVRLVLLRRAYDKQPTVPSTPSDHTPNSPDTDFKVMHF